MLGLPKATELSKQLPKTAIYSKFNMNSAAKDKFDADISRITIVNEISPATTSIPQGETISSFYVLLIMLKKKDFSEKTIIQITKLIPQNLILILQTEDSAKLATFHSKLMQTEWTSPDSLQITLKGLNLDAVWENIVKDIGNIVVSDEHTLDEQIAINDEKAKIEKEIDRLEKLARSERQPKKKFEYVQRITELKNKLEVIQ